MPLWSFYICDSILRHAECILLAGIQEDKYSWQFPEDPIDLVAQCYENREQNTNGITTILGMPILKT